MAVSAVAMLPVAKSGTVAVSVTVCTKPLSSFRQETDTEEAVPRSTVKVSGLNAWKPRRLAPETTRTSAAIVELFSELLLQAARSAATRRGAVMERRERRSFMR
jgi:hypothetical protein